MKTIIFDLLFAQAVGGTKFHGGGEYIKSVFDYLSAHYLDGCRLEVCYNTEAEIDKWIQDRILKNAIEVHPVKSPEDIAAVLFAYEKQLDYLFFTGMIYSYMNVALPKNIKKVGVCHGLRNIEMPYDKYGWYYVNNKASLKEAVLETFLKKRRMERNIEKFTRVIEKFDIIITDSEHSKYSIKCNLPGVIEKTDLRVFYAPEKISDTQNTGIDKKPYILMINANRWIKNGFRGVKAIDDLYSKGLLNGIETHVLGSLPDRIQKRIHNKTRFIFKGYVSTEELEREYKECSLFFYPTLNEGFGLPPMEAMKYGTTCVISAVCSLPEIYADAVYYCNPFDIQEMENRILQAIENQIDYKRVFSQIEKIRRRQASDLKNMCDMLLEG